MTVCGLLRIPGITKLLSAVSRCRLNVLKTSWSEAHGGLFPSRDPDPTPDAINRTDQPNIGLSRESEWEKTLAWRSQPRRTPTAKGKTPLGHPLLRAIFAWGSPNSGGTRTSALSSVGGNRATFVIKMEKNTFSPDFLS